MVECHVPDVPSVVHELAALAAADAQLRRRTRTRWRGDRSPENVWDFGAEGKSPFCAVSPPLSWVSQGTPGADMLRRTSRLPSRAPLS